MPVMKGHVLRDAPNFEKYLISQGRKSGGQGRLEVTRPAVERRQMGIICSTFKVILDRREIGEYQTIKSAWGLETISFTGTIPGEGQVMLGYRVRDIPYSDDERPSPRIGIAPRRYGKEYIPFP